MLLINNPFGANVYEAPSMTSNIVSAEPIGLIDEDEARSKIFYGWYKVVTHEGKHGYIRVTDAERV